MRFLVNASSTVIGGGVQVAVSLIEYANRLGAKHQWRFAVSPAVHAELARLGIAEDTRAEVVSPRPSLPWRGRKSRRILRGLEREFMPDATLTVFGPAYVRFRSPHLCGFANPWTTHPNQYAERQLSFGSRIRAWVERRKNLWFLRGVDQYWCESRVVADRLRTALRCKSEILIIPNTYSQAFDGVVPTASEIGDECRVLTLSAYYRHKNLEIIPRVAAALVRLAPEARFVFTLTLQENTDAWKRLSAEASKLGVRDRLRTVGLVSNRDCPDLYAAHDIVFLPTLLECSSAVYPEAMKMWRPLVTTDLDFARESCGDASLYYPPLSAEDAARCLLEVARNRDRRERLIQAGVERVRTLPDSRNRYERIVGALCRLGSGNAAATAGYMQEIA